MVDDLDSAHVPLVGLLPSQWNKVDFGELRFGRLQKLDAGNTRLYFFYRLRFTPLLVFY